MSGEAPKKVGEKKYPCKGCGAQLHHDAARGKLVCPYCGYTEEIAAAPAAGGPQEYDLEEALRAGRFEKGWGTGMRSIKCRSCGAQVDISPSAEATTCPFCSSPQVVLEKPPEDVFTPETMIPFAVDKKQALAAFRTWIVGGWFRPSELKQNWNMGKISGVYLPYWTFDADTHSLWKAMAGYSYDEVQPGAPGKTGRVRKIRWEQASGTHTEVFDDVLVFASKGLSREMVESIEPFYLKKLVPYKPEYLAGWSAERYTVNLKEGWGFGKQKISRMIEAACGKKVPGDTHKDLQVSTNWRQVKFKHVLLPIWVASYEYGGKVYRFLVNGETGKVHGEAPVDKIKVALAILAVLAALGAFFYLKR